MLPGVEDAAMIIRLFALWNLAVFLLYGADKRRARYKKRRISEKSLLLAAFFFGGTGALFGMVLFRHKTKHRRFLLAVPLFAALNIICILYMRSFGFVL